MRSQDFRYKHLSEREMPKTYKQRVQERKLATAKRELQRDRELDARQELRIATLNDKSKKAGVGSEVAKAMLSSTARRTRRAMELRGKGQSPVKKKEKNGGGVQELVYKL
jgi:hypothetical protein